jgi:hypothetical protein
MLDAARRDAIVSFEIDQLSAADGTAWSVLVQGLAKVVDVSAQTASARPSGSGPLVPEPGASLVRIRTGVLSGRRFRLRAEFGSGLA